LAAGPGGDEPATKTRPPVTLRSWIFQPGVPEPNDATDAALAAIKEKYPHITANDEGKGAANQAYVDAVVTATVGGGLPEMLYAQGPQIQGFIRNGAVRGARVRAAARDPPGVPPTRCKASLFRPGSSGTGARVQR
jgi:hypothetical protein